MSEHGDKNARGAPPGEESDERIGALQAHAALPPEPGRKSPVRSMIVLPGLVAMATCGMAFLGYWTWGGPKSAEAYAAALREGMDSGDRIRCWRIAREIAEHLHCPEIADPRVLSALLEIAEQPSMDEAVAEGALIPLGPPRIEQHARLRWWAAYLVGHLAGRLNDPRGVEALKRLLQDGARDASKGAEASAFKSAAEETSAQEAKTAAAGLRFFAAMGLGMLKDPASMACLVERLERDPDALVRAACAKALGAIGARLVQAEGASPTTMTERRIAPLRAALRLAYVKDEDTDVRWNVAIGLARIGDASGRQTLARLAENDDPQVRRNARQALRLLDGARQEHD